MIIEDKYYIDVLNQSLAIQNSLKSLDALILKRHVETYVAEQFINGDQIPIFPLDYNVTL